MLRVEVLPKEVDTSWAVGLGWIGLVCDFLEKRMPKKSERIYTCQCIVPRGFHWDALRGFPYH